MDSKLKSFIINTLRRASYRWAPKGNAEKKWKVKVGEFKTGRAKYGYKCSFCGTVGKKKDTNTDHTIPVIGLDGWISMDDYVERLFCDESNFRVLCIECHDEKTTIEKGFRKRYREFVKNDGELEEYAELREEFDDFIKKYQTNP